MLKIFFGLLTVIFIAGTVAKIFVTREKKPVRPQLRLLFNKLALILLVVSLGILVTHWIFNWPTTTTESEAASFNSTDITGANYGRDFSLTDHTGQKRTLLDFRGQVVLVFFGFTSCPDTCPTIMRRFQETLRILGPDAARLQALLITVDPDRDTPDALAKYLSGFHPSFLGLYGTKEEIRNVTREFRVFISKQTGKDASNPTVNHGPGSYAFDPAGQLRLFVSPDITAADLAEDVKKLLIKTKTNTS